MRLAYYAFGALLLIEVISLYVFYVYISSSTEPKQTTSAIPLTSGHSFSLQFANKTIWYQTNTTFEKDELIEYQRFFSNLMELMHYADSHVKIGYRGNATGWRDFSFRVQSYKQLFKDHHERLSDEQLDTLIKPLPAGSHLNHRDYQVPSSLTYGSLLFRLEKQLFPWAQRFYPSLLHMFREQMKSPHPRGIVMPVYQRIVRLAANSLYNIRYVHKSTLPILIVHSNELSEDAIEMFKFKFNADVINIDDYFDTTILGGLKGFQIKPFALLIAPFPETMLVDADAIFIQPPDVFFDDKGYLRHGALLFSDRTYIAGYFEPRPDWIRNSIVGDLSPEVKKMRWYREETSFEVEAGVVVIDKRKKFVGVAAICQLCSKDERKEIFAIGYGEKETFWQGLEMAGERFHSRPNPPSCLGMTTDTEGELCWCHLLHSDLSGKLMWFNGGIQINKEDEDSKGMLPTHYETEGLWGFQDDNCIWEGDLIKLSETEKRVVWETSKAYTPNPISLYHKEKNKGIFEGNAPPILMPRAINKTN